jgi:SAM-dependent methyltransferase
VSWASAQVSRMRPFYADYAEAYDLLVTDPAEPWAEAVHDRLLSSGWPSALVLDAGCGTGRHAAALAAKGHHVDLGVVAVTGRKPGWLSTSGAAGAACRQEDLIKKRSLGQDCCPGWLILLRHRLLWW